MFEPLKSFDPVARRSFLEHVARTMLGVTILPPAYLAAADAPSGAKATDAKKTGKPAPAKFPGGGEAKHVIYLYMTGAMSHLDTFDVVGKRANEGETKPIQSKVPGLTIANWMPELAKLGDKIALVRNLHTETADHEQGRYLMRTSYKEIASIRHPGMGAWIMKLQGLRKDRTLPDNVVIGGDNRHPGAGFLDPTYTPIPIGDPNAGLQNTKQPAYLNSGSFQTRMDLVNKFDMGFRDKYPQKQVEAYTEFYRQAQALMHSEDLKAFSLAEEKKEVRDKYGMDAFGQGCLLARRLVENDVKFIEVTFGNWDMHTEIYDKIGTTAGRLDAVVATLLKDLADRNLLKKTLVVVATEFGRTPKVNQNEGRDHHPGVFSGLLAGGGIKGGVAWGKSDKEGHSPDDEGTTVADFNATIAHALGLPLGEEVFSRSGRPFKVAHDGKPLVKLLS